MMEVEIWSPQIDSQACTGCGECLVVCPTDALDMVEGVAMVSEPEACDYCGECEMICPEEAISLPYQVVLAVDV